ncbi:acylglycerol kinase family protein [Desulfobacterota bacterium AH_259_B03_O07]|nr:acylglycerol kinase family protein [Desulfobacterota bacterium AH_259_B03_O07]
MKLRKFEKILRNNGLVRSTNSKDGIRKVVREFHENGIRILCISGGDGTLSSVLTTYINLYGDKELPLVVPLKGGTINFLSADVGLNYDQNTICRNLMRSIRNKIRLSSIERGTIKVTDSSLESPNYGFTWIDGLPYKFMKWYDIEGGGVGVALKLILKSFLIYLTNANHELFRPIQSSVYLNDEKVPYDSHLFIAAASVKRLVFGFRPFAEEQQPGNRFNIIYMRLPYFKRALYKLPIGLYTSLKTDSSGNYLNRSAQSVKIEGNRGYVIDGAIYGTDKQTDIKLELGPTLKILSFKDGN